MFKMKSVCVVLGAFFLLGAQNPLWQANYQGHQLSLSSDHLSVKPFKKQSAYSLFRAFPQPDPEQKCTYSRSKELLSFVGPYLSYRQEEYWNCLRTAHPGAYSEFKAIDIRYPNRRIQLTDIFAAKDIRAALLKDPLVKKALNGERPATLAKLLARLRFSSGECLYDFNSDLLERFAFHHIRGDLVGVRLGLSHGCGAARGHLTQLGIYLKLPAHWRAGFAKAKKQKQGFLMGQRPILLKKLKAVKTFTDPGYSEVK